MGRNVQRYRHRAVPRLSVEAPRSIANAPANPHGSADAVGAVLRLLPQGISVYDRNQRLIFFNARYAEIYGLEAHQLQIGMTLREVVDLRYQAGTGPLMTSAEYQAWLSRLVQTARSTDTEIVMKNGSIFSLSHQPTEDGGFMGFVIDITERHRAERRIQYMAHHDQLTGIPNRTRLFEYLDQTIEWFRGNDPLEQQRTPATVSDCLLGVLFLDLDRFKEINDTLGHAAGDELLQAVTKRIESCLRRSDVLARMGGDEFAIILDRGIVSHQQVIAVAQRVIDEIARPFTLTQHEVTVGITIGYTLTDCRVSATSSAMLLSQADLALYQAKVQQRGTYCAFEPGMDVALTRKTELERDLRRAVADETLDLHFQPTFKLSTREVVGAEALLRWTHPRYGAVSPTEFIPIAESTGLIVTLGSWVLRQACAQAVLWGKITIAVNLSPEQLRQPTIVATVEQILRETGLAPHRLELEITEGMLLRDTQVAAEKLHALRKLGIGIALDDFGTGYSSLSYLRRFPFSKLKIDRSFIGPISSDKGTAAIVQAIASLGHCLDMRVIAEGIETECQLAQIQVEGCDEAQGFLLGRPCTAESFEQNYVGSAIGGRSFAATAALNLL